MNDDDFSTALRGYLRRRDARVRSVHIEWPRAGSHGGTRMVALATVVGVFVAGAVGAGFAVLGSRSGVLTPGGQGSVGTPRGAHRRSDGIRRRHRSGGHVRWPRRQRQSRRHVDLEWRQLDQQHPFR